MIEQVKSTPRHLERETGMTAYLDGNVSRHLIIAPPSGKPIQAGFLGPMQFGRGTVRFIHAMGPEKIFTSLEKVLAKTEFAVAFLDWSFEKSAAMEDVRLTADAIKKAFQFLRIQAFCPLPPRVPDRELHKKEAAVIEILKKYFTPIGVSISGRPLKFTRRRNGVSIEICASHSFFDENAAKPLSLRKTCLSNGEIQFAEIGQESVTSQREEGSGDVIRIHLFSTLLNVHRWNAAEFPSQYMRDVAGRLIKKGAALVIGENSLQEQGAEKIRFHGRTGVAVYSLGRWLNESPGPCYQQEKQASVLVVTAAQNGLASLTWHPFQSTLLSEVCELGLRGRYLHGKRHLALSEISDWPKRIALRRSFWWLDGIKKGCVIVNKRKRKNRCCSLSAVGDINIRECALPVIHAGHGREMFKAIERHVTSSHIRFGNMESLLSAKGKPVSIPHRNNIPEALPFLIKTGFNILSCANNHFLDWGAEGALGTLGNLQRAGIKTIGAGKNKLEAGKAVIFKHNSITTGFLAYTDSLNVKNQYRRISIAMTEPFDDLLYNVKQLRNKVDFLVVSMHIGPGYNDYPNLYDRQRCYKIVDAGADLVIGHGSHVPQGLEIYKNAVLVHGLGNCFFGEERQYFWTTRGYVLKVIFGKRTVYRIEIVPFGLRKGERLQLLSGEEKSIFLDRLAEISGSL